MTRNSRVVIWISIIFFSIFAGVFLISTDLGQNTGLDKDLQKVIREFNLRPLQTRHFKVDPKFVLGRALFFDPLLSGPRDVSCATCHLLKYGSSDGLPRSIGVYGIGIGPERKLLRGKIIHPRNSQDLWNRDNNSAKVLFWDGRVEVLHSGSRRAFRSPLGNLLPEGLQNALAVQALFPLATSDEMLGEKNDRSSSKLPEEHASLPNDLVSKNIFKNEGDRIQDAHNRIMQRLLGSDTPNRWQKVYRTLFIAAYHDREIQTFSIVDLANAIAHYEEMAFATRDSVWDRYLTSQTGSISNSAKEGALLFYGKARCVSCHDGPLFSDFSFHSVGIFNVGLGTDTSGQDFGRGDVTGRKDDKYKFRTPPLRNVTKTAPYFHDGSEPTLKAALRRHLQPLDKADKYNDDGTFAMNLDQINSISPALVPRIVLSEKEIDKLISFLSSLDFEPTNIEEIVPKNVPSGLPFNYPLN